jgi:hypothetical protein
VYSRYWLTSDLAIEQIFVKGIFYYPDGSEGVAGEVVSSGALTSSPASLTVSAKKTDNLSPSLTGGRRPSPSQQWSWGTSRPS